MICKNLRWMAALTMAASLAITPSVTLAAPGANDGAKGNAAAAAAAPTTTPIKHVVVIFQENVSFDHYFATYPNAENPEGELKFKAKNATPAVDGMSQGLLEHNPNSIQPFRLDVSQNYTCSQDHDYMPEQQAFDSGLMDKFPEFTGASCGTAYPDVQSLGTGVVMGYFDGNTVTGLWNYAQNFAMSDHSWSDTFGPSAPGALEMFSGHTNGATFPVPSPALLPPGTPNTIAAIGPLLAAAGAAVPDGQGGLTLI